MSQMLADTPANADRVVRPAYRYPLDSFRAHIPSARAKAKKQSATAAKTG